MEITEEQINEFIGAVSRISSGGVAGPEGLEGLAMSISGSGPFIGANNLSAAIRDNAFATDHLADAIREGLELVAQAITDIKGD